MALLIGTDDGLYSMPLDDEPSPRAVMDDVTIRQVRPAATGDGAYAATESGLFRSDDCGEEWDDLPLPHDRVVSVFPTPDGHRLFAGTQPAHLYRSDDRGGSWTLCESFERLPGREDWEQLGPGGPQVRDLTAHPRAPGTVFAGVEAEGVYVTRDYGRSWAFRSTGLHRDPHALLPIGQDALIATCGRGVYKTETAGRRWHRVDTHRRHFWYSYFREACRADGTLFTSGQDRAAARFDADPGGVILQSTDYGETWDHVSFPGHESDFVNAWATADGDVFGGTLDGRVIRGPGEWTTVTTLGSTVRSLWHPS